MRIIFLNEHLSGSRSLVVPRALLWSVPVVLLLGLLAAVYGGYRFAVGQAGGMPAELVADWNSEISRIAGQAEHLRELTERDSRAYAARVAGLQARLLRMEAVGERLAAAANLKGGEFNFRSEPALGGPSGADSSVSGEPLALDESLDRLVALIDDRERQLEVMESLVSNRRLAQEVSVAGKPVGIGYISSLYGRRADPFDGSPAWHKGVDFTAPKGTPVIAVASGVVTRAGFQKDYGYIVEVRHSDGYRTRYAHNREFTVKPGDIVKKGQVIAKVGSTGRSTGPHVHFEVLQNGRQVDPMAYINAARASS